MKHKIKQKVKECRVGVLLTPLRYSVRCFALFSYVWLGYCIGLFLCSYFSFFCFLFFFLLCFVLSSFACLFSFVSLVIQLSIGSFHIILLFGFNYLFLFCFRVYML